MYAHGSDHTKHYRKNYLTQFSQMYFLTRIHRLLVTKKWRSTSPTSANCQGQQQTSQSIAVPLIVSSATLVPFNRAIRRHVPYQYLQNQNNVHGHSDYQNIRHDRSQDSLNNK